MTKISDYKDRPAATVPADDLGYPCHYNPEKREMERYAEIDSYDLTPLYGGITGVNARAARAAVRERLLISTPVLLHVLHDQILEVLGDLATHAGRRLSKKEFQRIAEKLSGVANKLKPPAPKAASPLKPDSSQRFKDYILDLTPVERPQGDDKLSSRRPETRVQRERSR